MRRSLALLVGIAISTLGCSAAPPTAPSGLTGTYHLRSLNGVDVPLAAPSGTATLDSGSIQVRTRDTIEVRRITGTPPANGLPGTSVIAVGFYVLEGAGGGFALAPGAFTTATPPRDTLYVVGDTVVIVEGTPRWQQGVRSTWRYTR
jgi:hypothetical protein